MLRSWRLVVSASCIAAAVVALVALLPSSAHHRASPTVAHAAGVHRAVAHRAVAQRVVLGRSVQGRPIEAWRTGPPGARAQILVVGCIHGNEPAGEAVARRLPAALEARSIPAWVILSLNPDGNSRDTRQNARGVDLNRNFPYRWQPLGRLGDLQYSGRHALSEPESRIAYRLILAARPRIAIWFHQPLGVVDDSGGSHSIEARFSRLSGLPLRSLTRYPGSAMGWQNHALPGSSAFVVELHPGALPAHDVTRLVQAVVTVAVR